MNKSPLSAAILLIAFAAPVFAVSPPKTYEGKVGKARAEFSLTWEDDGSVSGSYFYPDDKPFRYQLRGTNRTKGVLELDEYTRRDLTARLFLKKSEEAGNIVWRGTMKNLDGRVFEMNFSRQSGAEAAPAAAVADTAPVAGVKDVVLSVLAAHDLDQTPESTGRMPKLKLPSGEVIPIPEITLSCEAVEVSTRADGVAEAKLRLKPAFDGTFSSQDQREGARHRVIPSREFISVSSRKLAGIPLTDLAALEVYIVAAGPNRGRVSLLKIRRAPEMVAVKCADASSTSGDLVFKNPKSGKTFMIRDCYCLETKDKIGPIRGELSVHLNRIGWISQWWEGIRGSGHGDFSFLKDGSKLVDPPAIKDVTLEVLGTQDLDHMPDYVTSRARGYEEHLYVTFSCKCLSMETLPNGGKAATLELIPTYDGGGIDGTTNPDEMTKHRILPSRKSIVVTSKSFTEISLQRFLGITVDVVPVGKDKGRICGLSLEASIDRITKKADGNYLVDCIPSKGKGNFPLTVIPPVDANLLEKGATRLDGQLFLGEVGGFFALNPNGWSLIRRGAGPGGSDYSYLETKSARGNFD